MIRSFNDGLCGFFWKVTIIGWHNFLQERLTCIFCFHFSLNIYIKLLFQASTTSYMPALAGHTASSFSPYLSPSPMIPAGMMPADALAAPPPPPQLTSIVHTPIVTQKVPRTDRLEVRNI